MTYWQDPEPFWQFWEVEDIFGAMERAREAQARATAEAETNELKEMLARLQSH